MKSSERFPSRFVQASDLKPEGATVVIDKVRMTEIGSDKKEKPVVTFKNASKGLVLNRVNNDAIAELFGDDDRDWHGERICLYPTTTTFGGKTVPCIRVRAVDKVIERDAAEEEGEDPTPKPKKKSKPLPPIDDEIPW
jgi:hypothetical protein